MIASLLAFAAFQNAEPPAQPNLLASPPTFWKDGQAQASHQLESGVHLVKVVEPGPKPWGVQFFWVIPATNAKSKMRLSFSHKGTPGLTFQVRVQQAESPYRALGFEKTLETSADWRSESFEFETPYHDGPFMPILWLSSSPGEFSFRGVALRRLGPALSKAEPIRSEAGIFEWYDRIPSRFKAKDIDGIVGHWAESYVELRPYSKEASEAKRDRAAALHEFSRQALFETKFSNGPGDVCVTSIKTKGNVALVEGFIAGSYRSQDATGKLMEGGYSWQGYFEDKWELKEGRWLIVSNTRKQGYIDLTDEEQKRLQSAHKALAAKLGVKVVGH